MQRRNIDKLARVKVRPDPAQWEEDEVMTLIEAVAFSTGPIDIVILAYSSRRWDS
jgi:hypothetical protein